MAIVSSYFFYFYFVLSEYEKNIFFFWWLGAEFQIPQFSVLVLLYAFANKRVLCIQHKKPGDCDLVKIIFVLRFEMRGSWYSLNLVVFLQMFHYPN